MLTKFFFATILFSFIASASSNTVVVVNSLDWRNAYLASVYAAINDCQLKYVMGISEVNKLLDELSGSRFESAILFNDLKNVIPTLSSSMQTLNMRVDEIKFSNHHELSAEIIKRVQSKKVIIVRDDFAFDALSAKFYSQLLKAPIAFAKGIDSVPENVFSAMRSSGVSEAILVGRIKPEVEKQLEGIIFKRIEGKDEFDNSLLINEMASQLKKPTQGVITTGYLLEGTLLNVKNQPVIIVPEQGTYFLVKIEDFLKKNNIDFLLGIGQVTESSYWFKERLGTRIFLKLGSVTAEEMKDANVKKDIIMSLAGYSLPIPFFEGYTTSFSASLSNKLSLTGFASFFGKVLFPVEIKTKFINKGNMEYPAFAILRIFDENNNTLATIESEKQMAYPGKEITFKSIWFTDKTGSYNIEGNVFGEVKNGIVFQPVSQKLEVTLLTILIPAILMLILLFLIAVDGYSIYRLNKDLKKLKKINSE